MKNVRAQAKSGMQAKLSRYMGGKAECRAKGGKVYRAAGGAVDANSEPGPGPGDVEGDDAPKRLDRPARMKGDKRLTCAMTIRAGQVLFDRDGLSCHDYRGLGDYKRVD